MVHTNLRRLEGLLVVHEGLALMRASSVGSSQSATTKVEEVSRELNCSLEVMWTVFVIVAVGGRRNERRKGKEAEGQSRWRWLELPYMSSTPAPPLVILPYP